MKKSKQEKHNSLLKMNGREKKEQSFKETLTWEEIVLRNYEFD